jgi:hypothetical protein
MITSIRLTNAFDKNDFSTDKEEVATHSEIIDGSFY